MSEKAVPPIEVNAEESDKLDPRIWKVCAVVLLAPLMTQLDSTVVNFSLATIRDELHSTIDGAQWIISGYLLALALMLPLNGWLVDRIGAKKLYLYCFSAFTIASGLCGLATTMEQLIGARLLQGVFGGLLAPMTQMMIARIAGKQMARVIGYAVVPVLVAPILGPVVAGVVLKYAGWPWLFYINLPIGLFAVCLAAVRLPKDDDMIQRRRFDFVGFLLISPGLACLLYGFEHATETPGIFILIAGVLLLAAFIRDALRKKNAALIDLGLFKIRVFTVASVTQFLSNGVIYAGQMLVPLYLLTGCGLTAAQAGWLMAPMGVGMLCVSPMMGLLTDKFGCRAVSASGVVLTIVGTVPFIWMIQHDFYRPLMMICMFTRGCGQGAVGVPSLSAAYASVPKEKLALATTATNIVQRLGGPIATTLMAIVMSFAAVHFPEVGARAFLIPFGALVSLQLCVLASAIQLPIRIYQK